MIDGKTIADSVIEARRQGRGLVVSSQNTAALASYIVHLQQQSERLAITLQAHQRLSNTHERYVKDRLVEYVEEAEQALKDLREYVTWVEKQP